MLTYATVAKSAVPASAADAATRSRRPYRLGAAVAAACFAATLAISGPSIAQDELALSQPEPAPEVAVRDASRPHFVNGDLYWSNHALSGLCRDYGASFVKLAGSAVYICRLPTFAAAE